MCKKIILILAVTLILFALAVASLPIWFNLSALADPGRLETYIANKGKQWLVYRESRSTSVREPSITAKSLDNAQMIFGSECSDCHGDDGHSPSDIGRGLYPRAPDLGTAEVQDWSDAELFWIIRNGIRLSGMPAFGKQLSNEEMWGLARYVRSLRTQGNETSKK